MQFQRALSRISAGCRQELDDLTLEVYTEALCYQTTADEWERFTREAVASGRFSWFPKVVELLDALREFRGLPNLDAEAVAAYERVLDAGVYSAEGTSWQFRAVVDSCGKAAAEAFLEAGGHNAFAWGGRDEPKRRERFVSAYRAAAREDESARLLPPAPVKGLLAEPGSGAFASAHEILERVAGINAAEEGESERQPFSRPPRVVEATDDRLELLRRQAAEIAEQETPA